VIGNQIHFLFKYSLNMACLNTLKQEIRAVEKVFNKENERFQVLTATVDELACRFVCASGKKHDITANITVSTNWNSIQFKIL